MAKNIFATLKRIAKEMENKATHNQWDYLSTEEAANELVTYSDVFFNLAEGEYADSEAKDTALDAARDQWISEYGNTTFHALSPAIISASQIPHHEYVEPAFVAIITMATQSDPDYHAYSDARVSYDYDDKALKLHVADKNSFSFQPIKQMITDLQYTLHPGVFREFIHNGEAWLEIEPGGEKLREFLWHTIGDSADNFAYIPNEAPEGGERIAFKKAYLYEQMHLLGLGDHFPLESDRGIG